MSELGSEVSRVCRTFVQALLALRVSIKKSGIILTGVLVYVTWAFPLAAFNSLSLFCMFSALIIMCQGDFLF